MAECWLMTWASVFQWNSLEEITRFGFLFWKSTFFHRTFDIFYLPVLVCRGLGFHSDFQHPTGKACSALDLDGIPPLFRVKCGILFGENATKAFISPGPSG